MLDKAAEQEATTGGAKRRQLGRRNSEQQVDRIMNTKFSSLELVHRETHTVNGELLRDRLLRDKRNMDPAARFGACYYRDLLMEWQAGSAGWSVVKPSVAGESISDSLIHALELCSHANPNRRSSEPLEAFLRNTGPLNETELIGTVKAVCANSDLGAIKKDSVVIEVMQYLVRAGQTERWPKLMKVA